MAARAVTVTRSSTSPEPPRATYRLQFDSQFRFTHARALIPYLAALGISHVYASPLLMARPGSHHGYDIVDHNRLNPEIGNETEFAEFVAELHDQGMGLILDFVPNHMGIGADNPWWVDVLEWGSVSPYAQFFDIDWRPPEPSLNGKLLLPVLGDHYGAVLESGELKMRFEAEQGRFTVAYFEHAFPLSPRDYPALLQSLADQQPVLAGPLVELIAELRSALALRRIGERRSRIQLVQRRLAAFAAAEPYVSQGLGAVLSQFNGQPGQPRSFDALHRVLERQHYRLAFWRVAADEINYRRFFDVNDLAGLRMERSELFQRSHQLVGRLLADGRLQGLRLDHIDGLRDPRAYLSRLARLAGRSRGCYLSVEKILAGHESLREDWPVAGTTGYEFLNLVNGLLIDASSERHLTRGYQAFTGERDSFAELVIACKRRIMRDTLASELNVLANRFNRLAKQNRHTRDYSLIALRNALAEVVAHFPVYRTYVTARSTTSEDRRDLDWAVARARKAWHTPDISIFEFIHAVLSLDLLRHSAGRYRRRDVLDAALRFQQYTGPVMAKAVEDTAFYRYVRLVSLNDVGGEPDCFGRSPAALHEANRRRRQHWPAALLATATHDHKRGEDVRARLNVLSELPREWWRRVHRWARLNRRKRRELDLGWAPDRTDEYLFYQTLVGAWPYALKPPGFTCLDEFRQRLGDYMLKAVREAKRQTSWVAPDREYESGLERFVERTLSVEHSRLFLQDVAEFVDRIGPAAAANSLSQVLLKLTCPGVPDIYQGTEYWDLTLVDPDNRRPVDYAARQQSVAIASPNWRGLLADWHDGRIKQALIRRALQLRRRCPQLFNDGTYQAIPSHGRHAERLVAFGRQWRDRVLLVIAPRLTWPLLEGMPIPLPRGWEDTMVELPSMVTGQTLFDQLAGRVIPLASTAASLAVADLLPDLPVGLYSNLSP